MGAITRTFANQIKTGGKLDADGLDLTDTFAFTGTVTGAGGGNTPAWFARWTGDQSLSNDTATKVNYSTEDFDTNSAYDTTTNRFTVPTGHAGKYFFTASVYYFGSGENNLSYATTKLYKNGSQYQHMNSDFRGYRIYNYTQFITGVIDLAENDYLEVFAFTSGVGSTIIQNNNGVPSRVNIFSGYKIIE